MPLLQTGPVPPVPVPEALRWDEPVFVIRYTREIFREYEDYIRRLDLYRQPIWSCQSTGQEQMTYLDAMMSEEASRAEIGDIPEDLMPIVLRMIHFSKRSLNDLVDVIHEELKTIFYIHEEVRTTLSNNEMIIGKVTGFSTPSGVVLEPNSVAFALAMPSAVDMEMGLDRGSFGDGFSYQVRFGTDTEEHTFAGNELLRRKQPLSKLVLKRIIRDMAWKDNGSGSYWQAQPELVGKYQLPTNPPPNTPLVKRKKVLKRKRSEPDLTLMTPEKEGPQGETPEERAVRLEEARLEREAKRIKYPCEDTQIPNPNFELPPMPTVSTDFPVPMDAVGGILMVWDFLCAFGRKLKLYPFPLEDLEEALKHDAHDVPLIIQIQIAILRHLAPEGFEVNENTWREMLVAFLEPKINEGLLNIDRDTVTRIASRGLSPLSLNSKINILLLQIDALLNLEVIRTAINENIEKMEEKRKARKEEDNELRKQKKALEDKLGDPALLAKLEATMNGEDPNGAEKEDVVMTEADFPMPVAPPVDSPRRMIVEYQTALRDRELAIKEAAVRARKKEQAKARVKIAQAKQQKKKAEEDAALKEAAEQMSELKKQIEKQESNFYRELEDYRIRAAPLGYDRTFKRYWFFAGEGNAGARVFTEDSDSVWGYYGEPENLDAISAACDTRGVREFGLHKSLQRTGPRILARMDDKRNKLTEALQQELQDNRRSARVKKKTVDKPTLKYENLWA